MCQCSGTEPGKLVDVLSHNMLGSRCAPNNKYFHVSANDTEVTNR